MDLETAAQIAHHDVRRAVFALGRLDAQAEHIAAIGLRMAERMRDGGKILVFGNGGSAACAQHFAAEFTGKLSSDRRPLPAISLTVDTSAMTAIANDWGYEHVFSRQVRALAGPGDIVVGLTTSGTSANVVAALKAASEVGAMTVALTGPRDATGADESITVAVRETARVQEVHDLALHLLAQIIERDLIPDIAPDTATSSLPFVLDEDDARKYREWLRATGQTLVTTNGAFDLLHSGHRASLQGARVFGDALVVLVNSDASVSALKGPDRPIRSIDQRIEDLERIDAVDHVLIMDDADPRRLLGLLTPDVHAKGADYRDKGLLEEEVVTAGGGTIEFIELLHGFSTTSQVRRSQGAGE